MANAWIEFVKEYRKTLPKDTPYKDVLKKAKGAYKKNDKSDKSDKPKTVKENKSKSVKGGALEKTQTKYERQRDVRKYKKLKLQIEKNVRDGIKDATAIDEFKKIANMLKGDSTTNAYAKAIKGIDKKLSGKAFLKKSDIKTRQLNLKKRKEEQLSKTPKLMITDKAFKAEGEKDQKSRRRFGQLLKRLKEDLKKGYITQNKFDNEFNKIRTRVLSEERTREDKSTGYDSKKTVSKKDKDKDDETDEIGAMTTDSRDFLTKYRDKTLEELLDTIRGSKNPIKSQLTNYKKQIEKFKKRNPNVKEAWKDLDKNLEDLESDYADILKIRKARKEGKAVPKLTKASKSGMGDIKKFFKPVGKKPTPKPPTPPPAPPTPPPAPPTAPPTPPPPPPPAPTPTANSHLNEKQKEMLGKAKVAKDMKKLGRLSDFLNVGYVNYKSRMYYKTKGKTEAFSTKKPTPPTPTPKPPTPKPPTTPTEDKKLIDSVGKELGEIFDKFVESEMEGGRTEEEATRDADKYINDIIDKNEFTTETGNTINIADKKFDGLKVEFRTMAKDAFDRAKSKSSSTAASSTPPSAPPKMILKAVKSSKSEYDSELDMLSEEDKENLDKIDKLPTLEKALEEASGESLEYFKHNGKYYKVIEEPEVKGKGFAGGSFEGNEKIVADADLMGAGLAEKIHRAVAKRKDKLHKTLDKQDRIYYDMSKQSYRKPNKRKDIGNYDYNDDLSDNENAVYVNDKDKKIIVAFRGSVNMKDFKTDVSLAMGGIRKTDRYDSTKNLVATIKEIYPNYNISFSGHSLGGTLAVEMADLSPNHKSVVFNSAHTPLRKGSVKDKDITYYSTSGDLVSALGLNAYKNVKVIDGTNKHPLTAHSLKSMEYNDNDKCDKNDYQGGGFGVMTVVKKASLANDIKKDFKKLQNHDGGLMEKADMVKNIISKADKLTDGALRATVIGIATKLLSKYLR